MSLYKKHVDRRLKERHAINKVIDRLDALVVVLHMRNGKRGLFVAGHQLI